MLEEEEEKYNEPHLNSKPESTNREKNRKKKNINVYLNCTFFFFLTNGSAKDLS